MAASSDVIVRLRAVGQAAFKGAMDSAAKSITGVDKAADKADDSTGRLSKSSKGLRSTVGTMAKWAGGAAAVAGAVRGLKSAATSTMELGKTTMALERQTGMGAETASAWGSVLKARGVDSKQFGVGMTKLSKTMVKAGSDGKTFAATFKQLGISQDTVKAGDVNSVLMQSADAFSKMTNPAEKAAMAQQLFGKQAQNLLPLMGQGSKGIQEQLDMAAKYGATLSTKGAGGIKEMVAKQREMAIASEGLKITLGTALLPAVLSVANALARVVGFMQPLLRNSTALQLTLGLLTTAFLTLKVAQIASTIAALSFNAALLLIPLAVVALIAGLVYAYKRVGWFRDAVNATASAVKNALLAAFNWIRGHWVLLASILGGPFVAAAIQIARNWGKIKAGASSAVDWIKARFATLKALPGQLLQIGKNLARSLAHGITSAPTVVLDAIKSLLPGKIQAVGSKIGLWAHGGLVPTRQWGIVGERGPELMQLPGGTRITPLTAPSLSAPVLDGGGASGGAQTTAHFYLDRRLVASAVAQDTADSKARR